MQGDTPIPAPSRNDLRWRLVPLVVLVLAGAFVVAFVADPRQIVADIARHQVGLHDLVAGNTAGVALAYVLLYACLMTLVWIPPWLCTIVGGFLFGPLLGAGLAVFGATTGALLTFLLARRGLGGLVARAGPFVQRLEAGFRRNSLSYMIVLRLVPVLPFAAINIVCAVLDAPLRMFALATFLGIIPSSLIYASIGDTLGNIAGGQIALDARILLEWRFLLPLCGLALLALAPVVYRFVRNDASGDSR